MGGGGECIIVLSSNVCTNVSALSITMTAAEERQMITGVQSRTIDESDHRVDTRSYTARNMMGKD